MGWDDRVVFIGKLRVVIGGEVGVGREYDRCLLRVFNRLEFSMGERELGDIRGFLARLVEF